MFTIDDIIMVVLTSVAVGWFSFWIGKRMKRENAERMQKENQRSSAQKPPT